MIVMIISDWLNISNNEMFQSFEINLMSDDLCILYYFIIL